MAQKKPKAPPPLTDEQAMEKIRQTPGYAEGRWSGDGPKQQERRLGENPKDRLGSKKPQISLVPPAGIIAMAEAMGDGAVKYGPYNWRLNKVVARIYVDAAMRHIMSWLDGEENAEDSGAHHLGHAAACMAILLDAQATGNLIDDRPQPGAAARLIKEKTKS